MMVLNLWANDSSKVEERKSVIRVKAEDFPVYQALLDTKVKGAEKMQEGFRDITSVHSYSDDKMYAFA